MQITIGPKQVETEMLKCISRGLTPYITSSPGMGKSSIAAKVADQANLKLIDFRLSQCTPEDLQGYPMRDPDSGKAIFSPFSLFPLEGDELPVNPKTNEPYDGWMLLLDELSSAPKMVQAAAYKLILDRMVGSYNLHKRVAIVAAGNLATDKAVVVQMSTALQSRLIHFEMEVNKDDWMEWALRNDFDERILGFVEYMPDRLMSFRPDHQDKTFACPRTWEFLNRLIKGEKVSVEDSLPRIAGTISQGTASEFLTFCEQYENLPKIHEIAADPENVAIPKEGATKYACISMLVQNHTDSNLTAVLKYVERFSIEFQIIFAKSAAIRSPQMRSSNREFGQFLQKMVRYFH